MGAKRHSRRKVASKIGPRGPRGKTGRVGPTGPPSQANGEIARFAAQMAEVLRQLRTQFTRIAQLQLQLDRMAAGQSPHEIPASKRTDN
jgi:hypothetical protein